MIQRQAVQSSNIKSLGHDGSTLEVEFVNGSIFRYHEVPADVFQGVLGADSVGKAFRTKVKGGFGAERLTAGECPQCGAAGFVGDKCEDCGVGTIAAGVSK